MPAFEQYRFEIVSQEGVINTDITVSERRAMFAVDDYAPEIIDLFANVEKQVNAIPDELMDVLQSLKNIEGDG
ncbi:hypothetical protein D1871_11210 [Nakamurella silvestris]|nr:hypothetical protein D1871_11210 [Nakamurella silvestris]